MRIDLDSGFSDFAFREMIVRTKDRELCFPCDSCDPLKYAGLPDLFEFCDSIAAKVSIWTRLPECGMTFVNVLKKANRERTEWHVVVDGQCNWHGAIGRIMLLEARKCNMTVHCTDSRCFDLRRLGVSNLRLPGAKRSS